MPLHRHLHPWGDGSRNTWGSPRTRATPPSSASLHTGIGHRGSCPFTSIKLRSHLGSQRYGLTPVRLGRLSYAFSVTPLLWPVQLLHTLVCETCTASTVVYPPSLCECVRGRSSVSGGSAGSGFLASSGSVNLAVLGGYQNYGSSTTSRTTSSGNLQHLHCALVN